MRIISNKTVFAEKDYERARIPGIVTLSSGTIITYCELRQASDDWAVTDIGMKKSRDGGKSFSGLKILVSGNGRDTVNNPLMIADGNTLHFLYCINYRRVFYMKSTDEGESWTSPGEFTDCIKELTAPFFWSCIATGPCHGISLSDGTLLVPVWLAYNMDDEKSHHPSVIALLYSRDKGKSWKMGEIDHELSDPSEFSVSQLPDGRISANIRHEGKEHFRAAAEITEDFSINNIRLCRCLPDPVCCAGFIANGDGFLFTNCNSVCKRENLTLKMLTSDFSVAGELLLSIDGGYSDIAVSPDGKAAYVLFEKEKNLQLCVIEM
ncbi:MAG: exo-alpha-sialidase [Clostridia bacterium]|nr:exo-alpha-sialidase [Clostridia bacterium]